MGIANTQWTIQAAYRVENGSQAGTFGCVNRDTQPITVSFAGRHGSETIVLQNAGDSCTFALLGVDYVDITAGSYPATMALKVTTSDIVLDAAPILGTVPSVPSAPPAGFGGPFRSTVVTVGAVAVPLPATPLAGRVAVLVQNPTDGAGILWIGGASVTADEAATGGFQLAAGDPPLAADVGSGILYAISDGSGRTAIVLEFAG